MIALLAVIVCLALVVWVLGRPVYLAAMGSDEQAPDQSGSSQRAELAAARDAKLQEIRDAELDFRTGKLSEEDWRSLDAELRRDAAEILRELDGAQAAEVESPVS